MRARIRAARAVADDGREARATSSSRSPGSSPCAPDEPAGGRGRAGAARARRRPAARCRRRPTCRGSPSARSRCCGRSATGSSRCMLDAAVAERRARAATPPSSPARSPTGAGCRCGAATSRGRGRCRAPRSRRRTCRRRRCTGCARPRCSSRRSPSGARSTRPRRCSRPVESHVEGDSTIAAQLRVRRGRLRLAQRRDAEALADLMRAGEVARATGLVNPSCLPWRSPAALAHARAGRPRCGAGPAAEELWLARAFGAPRTLGSRCARPGCRAAATTASAAAREPSRCFERAGAPLELAGRWPSWARFLRRGKRRADARELPRAGARRRAPRGRRAARRARARPRSAPPVRGRGACC